MNWVFATLGSTVRTRTHYSFACSVHVSRHYVQLNLHCANQATHASARPRLITINFFFH